MAITAETLTFFQSERMTDTADGGGRISNTEVVHGQSNSIFDDTTEVDFASGDVSMRKIFAAVTSADDAKYLDAGAIISREPENPNVHVAMFSTGNSLDRRPALLDALQSFGMRGMELGMRLYGDHDVGAMCLNCYRLLPPGGLIEPES